MNKTLPQRQFLLPLSLALLISNSLFSQGENDNWIFGSGCYVSFATGTPMVLPSMPGFSTLEGCSSVSSSDGKLLFFTDGRTVRNKMNQIMENGTGLLGDPSSTSSSVVVPFPDHPMQYYIFCVESNTNKKQRFTYNIVDLNAYNGIGEIIVKNVVLLEAADEKIAVTRHCDGHDFWITTHEAGSLYYFTFLLTSSGINKNPVKSYQPGSFHSGSDIGFIKFSPDGKWLVNAMCLNNRLEVYRFNRKNGQLSLFARDYQNDTLGYQTFYGLAFSPNGSMLYASCLDKGYVFQYNLADSTQFSDRKTLLKKFSNRIGAMQLAKNNKLYFTNGYGSPFLHCIEQPDKLGTACILTPYAIKLLSNAQLGLPTYVESMEKYYTLGKGGFITYSRYTLNANIDNATYLWSTGDTTQTITVTKSGKYWVRINERNSCNLLTDTIELIFVKQKFKLINFDQTEFTACAGATMVIPKFISDSPNVGFYWKNTDTSIGLVAFGNGQIGSLHLHDVLVKTRATITVYPYRDTIKGSPLAFDIIVYPRAHFLPQKTKYQVCGGQLLEIDKFQSVPANTNYYWNCNISHIGLAASGSGNIKPFTTIPVVQNTTAHVNAWVQSAHCPADTLKLSILVNAIPIIADSIMKICSGTTMPEIDLDPANSYSDVAWQVIKSYIKIPPSGSKIIPAAMVPDTLSNDTTRIGIVVTSGKCTSEKAQLDIVTLSRPTIVPGMQQYYQVCSGDSLFPEPVQAIPNGTTINWSNDNTLSGIPASGNDNMQPLRLNRLYSSCRSVITFRTSYEGCPGDSLRYEVIAKPVPGPVKVADIFMCAERPFQALDLKSMASGLTVKWWSENGNPFIAKDGQDSVSGFYIPVLTQEKSINVNLYSVLESCKGDTSMFTINLEPKPYALFTFDSSFQEQAIRFINLSDNSDSYLWKFDDGTLDRRVNTSHTFFFSNRYKVTLYSSNSFCSDSFTRIIQMPLRSYVNIPNAFSPDGNFRNEYFKVYNTQDDLTEFYIYNRWGEEIYHTLNNTPWNGQYKDQPCQEGVYLYKVIVHGPEKIITVSGTVTLLR